MIPAAVISLLVGCGGDTEVKVVDFSQTVSVEQPGRQASTTDNLRVAVGAMISPRETVHLYHDLIDYIAEKLGREIELVQRKTYSQINELFTTEQIDLAFICSGPYATGKDRYGFHALAVPQINGQHLYHSYLIVHKDSPYQVFSDLKGKIFAFTDPDSNTGRLVPAYWLSLQRETPENYFNKTMYNGRGHGSGGRRYGAWTNLGILQRAKPRLHIENPCYQEIDRLRQPAAGCRPASAKPDEERH